MEAASRTVGIVLAGGEGRRVGGQDKGLLTLHSTPVVERVLSVLRPQCGETLIIANRHQDDYARFARVIGDEAPGHAGPLAGIVAALALLEREPQRSEEFGWLLTVPVDCPDPPQDLFARLHASLLASPEAPCAYARDAHKLQPLFALYSLKARGELLASARAALGMHASPLRWHMELDAIAVDFHDRAECFRNLNTLEDFQEYERAHPPEPLHPTRIGLEQALDIIRTRALEHRLEIERVDLAGGRRARVRIDRAGVRRRDLGAAGRKRSVRADHHRRAVAARR